MGKRRMSRPRLSGLIAAISSLLFSLAGAEAATEIIQTFSLRPGWNAIFLEVQPDPNDPASVFAGVPVDSVWSWVDRHSTVEFIQDLDEEPWGQPGWSVHFRDPGKAHLTNLHSVFANWAYLVKVNASTEVTLQVPGEPAVRSIQWVSDSFNLVGFRIDPEAPPSFSVFFEPSLAHEGQTILHLDDAGHWAPVENPAIATLRNGEAYWVYCEGSSDYQGPVRISLPAGDSVDFGSSLDQQSITLRNLSTNTRSVTVRALDPVPWLAYRQFDSQLGTFIWPDLATMPPVAIGAGSVTSVTIGVRRELMDPGVSHTVLEITDGAGTKVFVLLTAEKISS